LCGERVRGERCAQRGKAERVAGVKETVRARRSFELDESCGRGEQCMNWGEAVVAKKAVSQRRINGSGR
jgi:hypothetical protein